MNLPQLTAYIGENDKEKGDFGGYEKVNLNKLKVKENQQPYVVSMVFDLEKDSICFEVLEQYQEGVEEKYHYFGNNPRAGLQYYLTREIGSLKYLFCNVWANLLKKLIQYEMSDSSLYREIEILSASGFVNFEAKDSKIQVEIAKLQVDDIKEFNEDLIRKTIDEKNKNNRFVLVTPVIRKKILNEQHKEELVDIVLADNPDYLKLVQLEKGLASTQPDGDAINENNRVCYICKNKKNGVSITNSTKFKGSRINKVFEITTKRTSRYQDNFNYDDNYSFCNECYQRLLVGEKSVSEKFSTHIADENVFIIPEGLFGQFDYNYLFHVKKITEMFFGVDREKVVNWLENLEASAEIDAVLNYSINFIFYRTDGNSLSVLLTIEDVPTIRIKAIMESIVKNAKTVLALKFPPSLSMIYRIIPVRTNDKKEQIDISRVLTIYKALLQGELICVKTLYGYAAEALDKGMKQLQKSKIDNYYNLGLTRYIGGKEDFFIKDLIANYLILLKTCQQLNLLDCDVFNNAGEEVKTMSDFNSVSDKINQSVQEMEAFVQKQGFSEQAKALFYLGVLINRVAIAQMAKEHQTKPILRKIQFTGMSRKEVQRLYMEVVEKLRQYNKVTLFVEAMMNRFHNYCGLDQETVLDDQANVFYIMSGYAYLVGKKPADLSSSEVMAQQNEIDQTNDDVEGE